MAIVDRPHVTARRPSRAVVVRPSGAALAALLCIGALGGLALTIAPALLLHRAGFATAGNVVLVAGVAFGLWRLGRVAVFADESGITVRNVWSTDLLRWKRVSHIVSDRRLWLPGMWVPTLRLRGDDSYLPMLAAVTFKAPEGIESLRELWRGGAAGS